MPEQVVIPTGGNGSSPVGSVEMPREQEPRHEPCRHPPVGEPARETPRQKRRWACGAVKKRLWAITVRAYSGSLALVIAWVCLMALVYLFRQVFTPAILPPNFGQWQGRLDPAGLRQEQAPGVTSEAGRAPMAHYHKVERWFGTDPRNTCTTVGCHSPLPHPPTARIAAFPNLHVTFLDCGVCHGLDGHGPLDLQWVSTASGRAQPPPAVLRLTRLLEELGAGEADAVAAHPKIVTLLNEMDGVVGREPALDDLLSQIESSVPQSPFWRKSVQELTHELPLHARGEYGAKMVRRFPKQDAKAAAALVKAYFAAAEGSARRKDIGRQIHQNVLAKPGGCSTCHAVEGRRLDFAGTGYSPARTRALRTLPLAGVVERIRAGESFQLPKLTEDGDGN